jgi:hypothetical protein
MKWYSAVQPISFKTFSISLSDAFQFSPLISNILIKPKTIVGSSASNEFPSFSARKQLFSLSIVQVYPISRMSKIAGITVFPAALKRMLASKRMKYQMRGSKWSKLLSPQQKPIPKETLNGQFTRVILRCR